MSKSEVFVLKFGGTSVQDATAMGRVVEITRSEGGTVPVVVTSACAGITNDLVACGECCGKMDQQGADEIVQRISDRHHEILKDLCGAHPAYDCSSELEEMLGELRQLVHGTILLGETTPRTVDTILSFGERLSSLLLRTAFQVAGVNAALVDSRDFIITESQHGSALPIMSEIERRTPEIINPIREEYDAIIAQGFIGRTVDGITTTIGRGGSDHTAALIGGGLGAEEIQIWTDVDGVMTADPRIVPKALVVPEMTFTEARELAWFGAKVIHPDTILPAVAKNIPVVIRNSHAPSAPGTRIWPDSHQIAPGFHSLTIKRNLRLIELATKIPGEGREIIDTAIASFARYNAPIECAVIAESRASILVSESTWNDRLRVALESVCLVQTHPKMALLCLSGSGLRTTPFLLASPLAALADISIRLVAAGSSDHVVLLGIEESEAEKGLRGVHERLFEE
ncbi:MAG: aspartate kinase [Ignavibacteriae bacterium]|nr:aspartate kinase [Ignavibacteriota bacterium]MCB9216451.1 aspartate kinase [Ignavibacteria bacterium]